MPSHFRSYSSTRLRRARSTTLHDEDGGMGEESAEPLPEEGTAVAAVEA